MVVHLQHCYVALLCCHLIPTYLSYSILGGEFNHQVIGWSHDLPWVKGKSAQYGIVGKWAINNKECNILTNLLRVVADRHGQCDRVEKVDTCSSKPNEWHISWYESLSFDLHLLECRVIEDISRTSIINQDPVSIIVPYPNTNNECIVVWVVEMTNVFFRESNYRVVESHHFWDEACQLDVLNHPKVSLTDLLGWTWSRGVPYTHPYVPYGWLGPLVIPFSNLLLWWIYPFFADESL